MPVEREKVIADRALLRFLQRQGRISAEDILRLEGFAGPGCPSVIEVLESEGVIGERELALLLAQILRLPLADPVTFSLSPQVTGVLKGSIATKYEVLPLRLTEDVVEVATANPLDVGALRAVEFAMGRHARVSVATQREVRAALIQAYGDDQSLARSSTEAAAAAQPHTVPECREQNRAPRAETENAEPPRVDAVPTEGIQNEVQACASLPEGRGGSLTQSTINHDELTRPVVTGTPQLHAIQDARPRAAKSLRVAELQRLIEQAQREYQAAEAAARTRGEQAAVRAAEAMARADDAAQRTEALAAATQAREANAAELIGRLSADCNALSNSVREIEQRVTDLATQSSPRAELQQLIEQAHCQTEAEARTFRDQAAARAAEAMARADDAARRIEALAAVAQAREANAADLIGHLSADCNALSSSVREIEQRVTDLATQSSPRAELQQLIEQVQRERQAVETAARTHGERAAARAAEAAARADDAVQRIEALMATAETREANSAELIGRVMADCDALTNSVHAVERRVTALASRAEPSSHVELQQVIQELQRERREAEAEEQASSYQAAARAAEAMARADDAVQRIEALAAATQAREANAAEVVGRLSANYNAFSSSVREIEQRVTDLATQSSPRAELQQLLEQAHRQHEAESRAFRDQAAAGAAEAAARADDAVQRIEALAAATQAREANAAEVVGRLSANYNALSSSVREIEQRVTDLATQSSPRAELQQLLEQAHRQHEAESRAFRDQAAAGAAEAAARTDDAVQRIEALAAATQARETNATELIGRLSADCNALSSSVRKIEQRVTDLAARSPRTDLQQLLEQVQRECREAEAESRAFSEQAAGRAAEALACAGEATQRIEAVTATLQAHQERAENFEVLQASVEHLTEERKQLDTQVQEMKVWVATLSETVLTVLQRVRRMKAQLDASPEHTPSEGSVASLGASRVRSGLASAVSVAVRTPARLNAGASRFVHRQRTLRRRPTDLLLIGALILVATLAYLIFR